MPMARRHRPLIRTVGRLLLDLFQFVRLSFTSRTQLTAENLFLRKQLAFYIERQVKPRRADPASRVALVLLSRLMDWKSLLTVVKPDARAFRPICGG